MTSFEAWIPGKPQPQGSVKVYTVNGHGRVTSDNPELKSWRQDVAYVAANAARAAGWPMRCDATVSVVAVFYLAAPKTLRRRVEKAGGTVLRACKPDVDKLARALLDALTIAGVWQDDSQVVYLTARKATSVHGPGTHIAVRVVDAPGDIPIPYILTDTTTRGVAP